MNRTRTEVLKLLDTVKWLKERNTYFAETMISLSSKAEHERTIAHYDHMIEALKKELKQCPVGYRYTGKYFVKVAYLVPTQFEEGDGSLFMREDLVSWQIEKNGEPENTYHRAIYKEPYGELITRSDAEPVYGKED